jgi:uncharacterized membrane protein
MFGLLYGQIKKKVLGIVETSPEEKAKSAKKALIASRTNTLLI